MTSSEQVQAAIAQLKSAGDGLQKSVDDQLNPAPPPPRWQRRQHGPKHRGSKPRSKRAADVHVRRTNTWLRANIANYQGFMHDSILAALKDEKRSVVACSCSFLSLCPVEKADETWRSHIKAKAR